MFGFIEDKLAQLLHVPFEPFVLNGGGTAAMITRPYYIRVLKTLEQYWQFINDPDILFPLDKESDIAGMRIILHKFYYDDNVLDGLTTGGVKESESYQAIKNEGDGTQRFDIGNFETNIVRIYNELPMPEEERPPEVRHVRTRRPDERTQAMTAEDDRPEVRQTLAEALREVVDMEGERPRRRRRTTAEAEHTEEVAKEKTAEEKPIDETAEKLLSKLESDLGVNFMVRGNDQFHLSNIDGLDFMDNSRLLDFAQKVKRHVIISQSGSVLNAVKKVIGTKSKASQSFLIIATHPETMRGGDFTQTHDKTKSIAFGKEIQNLYVVRGTDVNKELEKLTKNTEGLTSSQIEAEKEKIFAEQKNSPYAKFDKIYKDTMTNVVFALQDRQILNFMFPANENKGFTSIVLDEIARRFDGTVPFSELLKIDMDYQAVLEKNNCDEYVKFVVESSGSVLRQLKQAYEEAKGAYEDYLTKALESGKMCSKYMEQIEAFNESEQQRSLKEKAYNEYMAVKSIDKIRTVFIKDEKVHIYTDNLYARDDRTKKMHDIGTFHITIGMHSNQYDTNNTVIIKNTKHQITAFSGQFMQAPHVFNEGYICHGTLATGMANAYKKRDLYQLVLQLMLFLQQANTDDAAGKYVNCWPEVSEELIKIQEEKKNEKQPDRVEFITKPEDADFDKVVAQAIPV